jgi:hypothetical protein
MKIQIVIIFGLFIFAYCRDLNCYDCDPRSEGKCVDPDKYNVKITNCGDTPIFAPRVTKENSNIESPIVEVVSQCFSLYAVTDGDGSGVYRGCIKISKDISNVCDYLTENLGVNITSCEPCSGNKCNLHKLDGGAV